MELNSGSFVQIQLKFIHGFVLKCIKGKKIIKFLMYSKFDSSQTLVLCVHGSFPHMYSHRLTGTKADCDRKLKEFRGWHSSL